MKNALGFAAAIMVLLASAALAQSPRVAIESGDAAYGSMVAVTWCSACHLVTPEQGGVANADVPSFRSIAQRLPSDADVLAAFIADPHPPMPNLALSRQDIRDCPCLYRNLEMTWLASWRGWRRRWRDRICGVHHRRSRGGEPTTQDKSVTEKKRGST